MTRTKSTKSKTSSTPATRHFFGVELITIEGFLHGRGSEGIAREIKSIEIKEPRKIEIIGNDNGVHEVTLPEDLDCLDVTGTLHEVWDGFYVGTNKIIAEIRGYLETMHENEKKLRDTMLRHQGWWSPIYEPMDAGGKGGAS